MKQFRQFFKKYRLLIVVIILGMLLVSALLLPMLGSLTKGLSIGELQVAVATYGWHGIYNQTFYLPLIILRSITSLFDPNHSQYMSRLPNVILGAVCVAIFGLLIKVWYGNRTAIIGTLLFACGAWVLHVSRLASYDVLYLLTLPSLLLSIAATQRFPERKILYYLTILLWGALLYIPGGIWLVILSVFWQGKALAEGWKNFETWWQKLLLIFAGIVWLPLLIINLARAGQWQLWLGLPTHFSHPLNIFRQFFDVFFHLFFRGPYNPSLWLDHSPILDIFTLVMAIIGIYFYAIHYRVGRTKILASYFILGSLLISLGGAVSLSLLVPVLYICAATGIAYLLHEWLKVFPINPYARSIGIGLIVIAVSLSCIYNLRAYFVAWPHNSNTQATFIYRR